MFNDINFTITYLGLILNIMGGVLYAYVKQRESGRHKSEGDRQQHYSYSNKVEYTQFSKQTLV